jgi:hypothetical protein
LPGVVDALRESEGGGRKSAKRGGHSRGGAARTAACGGWSSCGD